MKKSRLSGLLGLLTLVCSEMNAQTSTQLHNFGQHVKAYSVMNSTDGPHPDETVRSGDNLLHQSGAWYGSTI